MEINRYLRHDQPAADGRRMIQLKIAHLGWTLKVSSGQKALPAEWDEDRQRIHARAPFAASRNRILDTMSRAILDYADRQTMAREAITQAELKAFTARLAGAAREGKLDELMAPPSAEPPPPAATLAQFVEDYISDHRAMRSDSSQRKYRTVVRHLLAYQPELAWEDLTLATINQFIAFMTTEMGLTDNTAYAYVNRLANLIEYAQIKGLPVSNEYKLFPSQYTPAVRHWHTEDELAQIAATTYTSRANHLTADAYLLGCYSGLRVSDLSRFDPALHVRRIEGEGKPYRVIDLSHMVKTRQPVQIALSPYAEDILDRWGTNPFRLLPFASPYHYNNHIKQVGVQARITAPVAEVAYRANRRYETTVPKYSVMSSHMARHTFACNSVLRGMDVMTLRDIMGHKDIQSTMVYVHIADEFRNRKMLDVWGRR